MRASPVHAASVIIQEAGSADTDVCRPGLASPAEASNMNAPRMFALLGLLLFAVLIRLAMNWGAEWSLLLLFPVGFLVIRDLLRWRRGGPGFSFSRSLARAVARTYF